MPGLPETGQRWHNPAVVTFPEISRRPAIKTRTGTSDPTLRDQMQNGAEATGLQFGRGRRTWDVTIENLTADDQTALETFYRDTSAKGSAYGVNPFLFVDNRDPRNPVSLHVKFAQLPSFTDVAVSEGIGQNCTFQLREV